MHVYTINIFLAIVFLLPHINYTEQIKLAHRRRPLAIPGISVCNAHVQMAGKQQDLSGKFNAVCLLTVQHTRLY